MENATNTNGTTATPAPGVGCYAPFEVMQDAPVIPIGGGRGISINGHFVAFAAGAGTVLLIMFLISKCNDR